MPTIFAHAAIGWGLARAARRPDECKALVRRREVMAAVLALMPDLDVVSFTLGIPYAHPLGHRGLSHSLLAGLVFGVLAWLLLRLLLRFVRPPDGGPEPGTPGWLDLLVLCAAACSHGPLDMLTGGGGLGVALLAPFTHERLFFPVRPVPVSPIGLRYFLSSGLPVLAWELVLLCPLAAIGWLRSSGHPTPIRAGGATALVVVLLVAWALRL